MACHYWVFRTSFCYLENDKELCYCKDCTWISTHQFEQNILFLSVLYGICDGYSVLMFNCAHDIKALLNISSLHDLCNQLDRHSSDSKGWWTHYSPHSCKQHNQAISCPDSASTGQSLLQSHYGNSIHVYCLDWSCPKLDDKIWDQQQQLA